MLIENCKKDMHMHIINKTLGRTLTALNGRTVTITGIGDVEPYGKHVIGTVSGENGLCFYAKDLAPLWEENV